MWWQTGPPVLRLYMAAMTLAQVETKINALLESPQVDYRSGDLQVSASQKLKQLLAYREHLLKHPAASQAFVSMDLGTNEFGIETGEFED